MESLCLEKLLPQSGYSVYRLVRMAANRCLELSQGRPPLIRVASLDKVTSVALKEIIQGKIKYAKIVESGDKGSGDSLKDQEKKNKNQQKVESSLV